MQVLQRLRVGLHDLAQPLTALQCRLWLGTTEQESADEAMLTLHDALTECERMIAGLRAMQNQLDDALNEEGN